MAWNPNIPTLTNRVQDDLDAIRGNFQVLDGHLADTNNPHNVQAQQVPYSSGVVGFSPADVKAALDALAGVRIIEMGFNSNGTYVRWENRLQVCWHRDTNNDTTTPTQHGSIYKGEGRTWIYPAAFVVTPTVLGAFHRFPDDRAGFIGWHSVSVDSAVFYVATTAVWSNLSAPVHLVAVGRWK